VTGAEEILGRREGERGGARYCRDYKNKNKNEPNKNIYYIY
jgi:hypothetical protein